MLWKHWIIATACFSESELELLVLDNLIWWIQVEGTELSPCSLLQAQCLPCCYKGHSARGSSTEFCYFCTLLAPALNCSNPICKLCRVLSTEKWTSGCNLLFKMKEIECWWESCIGQLRLCSCANHSEGVLVAWFTGLLLEETLISCKVRVLVD